MTSELSCTESNGWLIYRGDNKSIDFLPDIGSSFQIAPDPWIKKKFPNLLFEPEGFSFLIILYYFLCVALCTISVLTFNVQHMRHSSSYNGNLFLSYSSSHLIPFSFSLLHYLLQVILRGFIFLIITYNATQAGAIGRAVGVGLLGFGDKEVEFGWESSMMPLPQTTTRCCYCSSMNDYGSHVARMSIKTTVNLLPTARNLDAVLENGPQMMHSYR